MSRPRRDSRTTISGINISGTLVDPLGPTPIQINDISATGLGIWTPRPLKPGEKIILFPNIDQEHGCKVVWCQSRSGELGYFCGLKSFNDLHRIFEGVTNRLIDFAIVC